MAYDYEKEICDECGKEKDSDGFFLDTNGGVLCPKCHKEQSLENLFRMMDEKELIKNDRKT